MDAPCTVGNKIVISKTGLAHAMAGFHRGKNGTTDTDYMIVPNSIDSGLAAGGISFYNWDNPGTWSNPVERAYYAQGVMREQHGLSTTNLGTDWNTWLIATTQGFFSYNFDSVTAAPAPYHYLINSSTTGGTGSPATCSGTCLGSGNAGAVDYYGTDGTSSPTWMIATVAPYIYVALSNGGLAIYKFGAAWNSISFVKRYDRSWFGHRVQPIWIMGNVMIAGSVDTDVQKLSLIDASDPENLVKKVTIDVPTNYFATLNGGRVYLSGKDTAATNDNNQLMMYPISGWSFGSLVTGAIACGGGGGYPAVRDGSVFSGFSGCWERYAHPLTAGAAKTQTGTIAGNIGEDNDFAMPFSNYVWVGNDHQLHPGSGIFCTDAAADTAAPAVTGHYPGDSATGVNVKSGVGFSFSDMIKQWTVNSSSIQVRRKGSTAVAGKYSYQQQIVNFRPDYNFNHGTTYEHQVYSSVQDIAGNGSSGHGPHWFRTQDAHNTFSWKDTGNPEGSVQFDLQNGATAYGDRTFTIVNISDALKGRTWIRPANDSKAWGTGSALITFNLNTTSDIYVCWDNRVAKPSWVPTTDSGYDITISEGTPQIGMTCWLKDNASGAQTFYGGGNTGVDNYIVIIKGGT